MASGRRSGLISGAPAFHLPMERHLPNQNFQTSIESLVQNTVPSCVPQVATLPIFKINFFLGRDSEVH